MDDEHMAARPTWDCRTCGEAWPCEVAQKQMIGEMDPTQLRIFVWMQMEEAAEDIPGMKAGEMFERFLAWA